MNGYSHIRLNKGSNIKLVIKHVSSQKSAVNWFHKKSNGNSTFSSLNIGEIVTNVYGTLQYDGIANFKLHVHYCRAKHSIYM